MRNFRTYLATLALLCMTSLAFGQSPAATLAARIKQETGMQFTWKTQQEKSSGSWACVVLLLDSPDAGKAKAIGLLERKKTWSVRDYVIGTDMKGVLAKLRKKHPKAPKSIFPEKL